MMLNSGFVWLNFDEDFNTPNEEVTKTFTVDGEPVAASRSGVSAEGFILIQARDVGLGSQDDGEPITHRILINGKHLPSFDIITHDGWNLWMDRIPDGVLVQGGIG